MIPESFCFVPCKKKFSFIVCWKGTKCKTVFHMDKQYSLSNCSHCLESNCRMSSGFAACRNFPHYNCSSAVFTEKKYTQHILLWSGVQCSVLWNTIYSVQKYPPCSASGIPMTISVCNTTAMFAKCMCSRAMYITDICTKYL